MRATDVRDLQGRLWRLVWAVEAGVTLAVLIAAVLPQRSQRGWGGGAMDLTNPVLVAAGACGIAIAIYAVLDALARRARRPRIAPLPRARVLLPARSAATPRR